MDYYDIDRIIKHASMPGVDISPADRQEWAMFCCALKVLNYSLSTFVAMSNCDEAACVKKWNEEKNPQRYVPNEEAAKAKIIALAKNAGIDMNQFRLNSANATQRPTPDAFDFCNEYRRKTENTCIYRSGNYSAHEKRYRQKCSVYLSLSHVFPGRCKKNCGALPNRGTA